MTTTPFDPEEARRLAQARRVGAQVSERVRGRSAQVRRAFFDATLGPPGVAETPLSFLLHNSGRAGDVRLKLLLSALWVGANPPHDITTPARTWASLLGLEDPAGAGARRVNDALGWLADHEYLTIVRRPGQATQLFLVDERRNGEPYRVPGEVLRGMRDLQSRRGHFYVQIPAGLWSNGWIQTLSALGTGMLLILLAETSSQDEPVWFSPTQADERFWLTAQSRSRGIQELAELGLVTIRRRALSRDVFAEHRYRNTYTMHPRGLQRPPGLRPDQREGFHDPEPRHVFTYTYDLTFNDPDIGLPRKLLDEWEIRGAGQFMTPQPADHSADAPPAADYTSRAIGPDPDTTADQFRAFISEIGNDLGIGARVHNLTYTPGPIDLPASVAATINNLGPSLIDLDHFIITATLEKILTQTGTTLDPEELHHAAWAIQATGTVPIA